MSNYIINNIPSSNRKDFGYKAINSSSVHNENQQEILNDILDLFNKTNSIEKVVNEQLDYIKLENTALESIYLSMYNKYIDLYKRYESMLNIKENKSYIVTAQDLEIYDDEFGAIIDNVTSDVTVRPSKKISKFVLFDSITDSTYIPDTLNVNVYEPNDKGIISATSNDIYAPFYNDNNLYFTRKVVTDNTVEQIESEYIIDLPEDIMTTYEMNEIFISPFLCRVKNVYCRFGDSNTWELIHGQENHDAITYSNGTLGYINNNRPFRLNFPNTRINQIKIILVSSTYTECETNLRTFMYGLKQVAGYINYYNDCDASTFQFDLSMKDHKGLVITGVTPYFNNSSSYGKYYNDFAADIYYKDTEGYYHKIVDTFPFIPPTEDIRVKCRFGKNLKESNIKRIELNYKSNFKLPPEIDVNEIKQIDSKGSHVVALKLDGSVWTWGSNSSGQLTNYTNINNIEAENISPVRIKELEDIKEISTGIDYTLALKKDGTVYAFGNNYYGQLGSYTNIGTHEPNVKPTIINGLSNIVHISAGSWHGVAVNTAGEVFTWGYNYYGQLGRADNIGTHEANHIPIKVDGLEAIVGVEAGSWHTTALKSDNKMFSWGYNESGQLGYETDNEYSYVPKLMNIF